MSGIPTIPSHGKFRKGIGSVMTIVVIPREHDDFRLTNGDLKHYTIPNPNIILVGGFNPSEKY